MKTTIFFTIIFTLFLTPYLAHGQTAEMSTSAKELAEQIKVGNTQSILDAGTSGNKTVIPYLIALDSNSKVPWAQMALAKLGEEKYLNQILAEVDSTNPSVQDRALEKLAYVGGKVAFKKFYELLDDTTPRESPSCKEDVERFQEFQKTHPEVKKCGFCCDAMFFDRSTMVIFQLNKLLKNYSDTPPRYIERNPHPEQWHKELIVLWKAWFVRHKDLIE